MSVRSHAAARSHCGGPAWSAWLVRSMLHARCDGDVSALGFRRVGLLAATRARAQSRGSGARARKGPSHPIDVCVFVYCLSRHVSSTAAAGGGRRRQGLEGDRRQPWSKRSVHVETAARARARVDRFESAKRRMEETHLENLRASCPQLPPPPGRRRKGACVTDALSTAERGEQRVTRGLLHHCDSCVLSAMPCVYTRKAPSPSFGSSLRSGVYAAVVACLIAMSRRSSRHCLERGLTLRPATPTPALGSRRARYLTDFDLAMSWNGGLKSRVVWWWHDLELSRRFWCALDASLPSERAALSLACSLCAKRIAGMWRRCRRPRRKRTGPREGP